MWTALGSITAVACWRSSVVIGSGGYGCGDEEPLEEERGEDWFISRYITAIVATAFLLYFCFFRRLTNCAIIPFVHS